MTVADGETSAAGGFGDGPGGRSMLVGKAGNGETSGGGGGRIQLDTLSGSASIGMGLSISPSLSGSTTTQGVFPIN